MCANEAKNNLTKLAIFETDKWEFQVFKGIKNNMKVSKIVSC